MEPDATLIIALTFPVHSKSHGHADLQTEKVQPSHLSTGQPQTQAIHQAVGALGRESIQDKPERMRV